MCEIFHCLRQARRPWREGRESEFDVPQEVVDRRPNEYRQQFVAAICSTRFWCPLHFIFTLRESPPNMGIDMAKQSNHIMDFHGFSMFDCQGVIKNRMHMPGENLLVFLQQCLIQYRYQRLPPKLAQTCVKPSRFLWFTIWLWLTVCHGKIHHV